MDKVSEQLLSVDLSVSGNEHWLTYKALVRWALLSLKCRVI